MFCLIFVHQASGEKVKTLEKELATEEALKQNPVRLKSSDLKMNDRLLLFMSTYTHYQKSLFESKGMSIATASTRGP